MQKIAVFSLLALLYTGLLCTAPQEPAQERTGAQLAKQHCATCHLYPEPDLLDKKTWKEFVLLRMAAYYGIYTDNKQYFDEMPTAWMEPGEGGERLRAANIYPAEPILSIADWEKIRDFYLAEAPEQLKSNPKKLDIEVGTPFFKSRLFENKKVISPLVQALGMDEQNGFIYATGFKEHIYKYDQQGQFLAIQKQGGNFVQIEGQGEKLLALDMGTRYASDHPRGKLLEIDMRKKHSRSLVNKLMRPVHFSQADLNGDGVEDFVICEYGNKLGALSWYPGKANDRVGERQVLWPEDGAVKTAIADFNNDGKLDILALMANADEGFDLYLNQGEGKFKRERKLRFLPSYGSTHFQLVDFNQDGQLDILYANGDNGDYTPILKPYHGIRLFINDQLNFTEAFFIPHNGIYQVEAQDFDEDGDMDIAAVAWHPDFKDDPKESFVIYKNNGEYQFKASTIKEYDHSRWMRFVTTDIDGDKDLDILLSAMNVKTPDVPSASVEKWKKEDRAILLLENNLR